MLYKVYCFDISKIGKPNTFKEKSFTAASAAASTTAPATFQGIP
jgi:hypothetical protein